MGSQTLYFWIWKEAQRAVFFLTNSEAFLATVSNNYTITMYYVTIVCIC